MTDDARFAVNLVALAASVVLIWYSIGFIAEEYRYMCRVASDSRPPRECPAPPLPCSLECSLEGREDPRNPANRKHFTPPGPEESVQAAASEPIESTGRVSLFPPGRPIVERDARQRLRGSHWRRPMRRVAENRRDGQFLATRRRGKWKAWACSRPCSWRPGRPGHGGAGSLARFGARARGLGGFDGIHIDHRMTPVHESCAGEVHGPGMFEHPRLSSFRPVAAPPVKASLPSDETSHRSFSLVKRCRLVIAGKPYGSSRRRPPASVDQIVAVGSPTAPDRSQGLPHARHAAARTRDRLPGPAPAMLASGLPAVELARLAGVEQGAIGRFERGDGLALSALDALARALRLELMPAPPAMDVITRSSVAPPMIGAADGTRDSESDLVRTFRSTHDEHRTGYAQDRRRLTRAAWPRRRRRRVPRIAHGRDAPRVWCRPERLRVSSGWPIAPPRPRCSGD